MKYAFNREGEKIKGWDKTNRELLKNLEEIREGNCTEEEMKLFLLKAVDDASVSWDRETAFWYYDIPNSMSADARCDYVYRPTYLITLSMVNIINRHPKFMKLAGVEETLRYALNACVGRNLHGSGYDSYKGLCNNVLFFLKNGIVPFMRNWPLFSVQFEDVFRNSLNGIEQDYTSGNHEGGLSGRNCKAIQGEIIKARSYAMS